MLHIPTIRYFVKVMLWINHLYATMFSLAFYAILACWWINLYGNLRVKFITCCKKCISFVDIVLSILNFRMSICITSNMPVIMPSTHLHKYFLWSCFVLFSKSLLDFIFGKDISVDGHSDVDEAKHSVEQMKLVHQRVQEKLEKIKTNYKVSHDKNWVDHDFQVGDWYENGGKLLLSKTNHPMTLFKFTKWVFKGKISFITSSRWRVKFSHELKR